MPMPFAARATPVLETARGDGVQRAYKGLAQVACTSGESDALAPVETALQALRRAMSVLPAEPGTGSPGGTILRESIKSIICL